MGDSVGETPRSDRIKMLAPSAMAFSAPANTVSSAAASPLALSAALNKMAADPTVVAALRKAGAAEVKDPPEQFAAQIKAEAEQWGPLLREIMGKK